MRALPRARVLAQRPWFAYVAVIAAVAAMTGFIGLVLRHIYIANISMVYLIVVLAAAVAYGRGPAILASVAAFLTFDWFFLEPAHTFVVASPEEWIALVLFLITAVITGHLTASVRKRALQAEMREREAAILYDVALLLGDVDPQHGLQAVVERLRQELQLAAVAIELLERPVGGLRVAAGDLDALARVRSVGSAPADLLSEGTSPSADRRGTPGRWIRLAPPQQPAGDPASPGTRPHLVPIRARGHKVGTMTLLRPASASRFQPTENRLLAAVGVQVGLAIERAALRREATEAEVLRRADHLKTALINAVSHDLRTPLASIIASAGSLRQRDVDWTDEDRDEFAAAIEDEARRLNRIVGNLLDLSRIEGGSLRPEKRWYDVEALVDAVLDRVRFLTDGHNVVVSVPEDVPPVLLDPVEIDQVLSNLIENAAKFSPQGTDIELFVAVSGGELRVTVADHGPGIPSDALPSLFKPFFQVGASGARAKGAGVGLAVARGLVEAHGGRMWVESPREGGARFVFTIPLPAPVEPATMGAGAAR